jgi:lysozyme family protein
MADYKNIINFIKSKEGGLSSKSTDNASRYPSPCGKGSNGLSYHTNKGVQWVVFQNNASQLGYTASCSNFLSMPNDIWAKIYKELFWNNIKGDDINNQAIANTLVEWAWLSGVNGSLNSAILFFKTNYNKAFTSYAQIAKYVNELDNEGRSGELFDKLYSHRVTFYKNLNQPDNYKGWINRLKAFYLQNKIYALSKGQKVAISIGAIAILAASIYYYYGNISK